MPFRPVACCSFALNPGSDVAEDPPGPGIYQAGPQDGAASIEINPPIHPSAGVQHAFRHGPLNHVETRQGRVPPAARVVHGVGSVIGKVALVSRKGGIKPLEIGSDLEAPGLELRMVDGRIGDEGKPGQHAGGTGQRLPPRSGRSTGR